MFQQSVRWVVVGMVASLAAISFAACAPQAAPATAASGARKESLPAAVNAKSGVQCPAKKFEEFLGKFANDAKVQRAFTRYPYVTTVYDAVDLEADPKVSRLTEAQVAFPVMLSDKALLEHGASMQPERKSADWYEVSTQSEGSGAYTMTFTFRYQNECWYLTESIDAST